MIRCALMLFLIGSLNISAVEKVIYGDDNRKEIYELQNEKVQDLGRSVAAQIHSNFLSKIENTSFYKITGPKLGNKENLCEEEPFYHQPASADCTGFLVAPNILITAAHCVMQDWDGNHPHCKSKSWLFNYKNEHRGQEDVELHEENIYKCKEVKKYKLDDLTGLDYAVIELDRPVKNAKPLKYRTSGKIQRKQSLFVMGHPMGLPLKVSGMAKVRHNTGVHYFVANLDTFSGSSGSPVISTRTGLVEGLLVKGEDDFILQTKDWCQVSKKCTDNGCRGEDVMRITSIPYLMPKRSDLIF